MTRQVRLTAEQYDEWQAKVKAQKMVRGGVSVQALQGPRPGGLLNGSAEERPQRHASRVNSSPVTNPVHAPTKLYDSKWEETYAGELVLRKHAGLVKNYWYHPWTFWLPGHVKLEIDFLIQYPDGLERRLQVMEIKGWHKNIREAMAKLKIAASIWPCFQWTIGKRQKGGGWDETDI